MKYLYRTVVFEQSVDNTGGISKLVRKEVYDSGPTTKIIAISKLDNIRKSHNDPEDTKHDKHLAVMYRKAGKRSKVVGVSEGMEYQFKEVVE